MGLKQSKINEDSRFDGPSDYDKYKKLCDDTANRASLRGMLMSTTYENDNFYCYLSTSLAYEHSCLMLPKQIFLEKITDEDSCEDNCEDNCSICLEKLVNKRNNPVVKISKCGHKFHYKCIKDTLQHCGEKCPLCRQGPDLKKVMELKERQAWIAETYNDDSDY
jgi:hypothetical protein